MNELYNHYSFIPVEPVNDVQEVVSDTEYFELLEDDDDNE